MIHFLMNLALSDHCPESAMFLVLVADCQTTESSLVPVKRNPKPIKIENALKFIYTKKTINQIRQGIDRSVCWTLWENISEFFLPKRIWKFCGKSELLSSVQYSFRPEMSCIQAINKVIERLRAKLDLNYTGQACFMDLKKASGTLNHRNLLTKSEYYGLRDL